MKTALVTGASSGIGQAICQMLLNKGYHVYGIGRTFTTKQDEHFIPIVCDLKIIPKLLEQMKEIKEQTSLDLLVNCAGVGYYGLHEELNAAKIHEMVTVNLEVPMVLTNFFLRDLKKQKGTIINISSVTAQKSNPHGCAYGATKAALSSFSTSLFDEARKYGVKVISIHPDMTKTNLYRYANFKEGTTTDTYLLPSDVADAINYLLDCRIDIVPTQLTLQPQRHQITKK